MSSDPDEEYSSDGITGSLHREMKVNFMEMICSTKNFEPPESLAS
jgi:hypothetical protein